VPPPNRNGIGDENSDPELLAALRRALPLHRVAVTSAQVDPGATQIALALMLPADVASGGGNGSSSAAFRERVLRETARAVRIAGEQRPQIARATVRVSAGNDPATAPVVFSAETATTAFRTLDPESVSVNLLDGLFTSTWWAPQP
jgi:hypothetical protein